MLLESRSRLMPLLAACLSVAASSGELHAADPPRIERIEPPNWWAGHSINPVRLLVRGSGLVGLEVESTSPALTPGPARVNERGTAAFLDLAIDPATPPGEHRLRFRTPVGEATADYRILMELRPSLGKPIGTEDVLYLIMTDRFANGDPSNDRPPGSSPDSTDRDAPRGWHGGDFQGILDRLPDLQALGVTALWLTPWYDNSNAMVECDEPWCPYTAYHGYHPTDHYAVEDHFGDMEALRRLADACHERGIKLIQDQIANHVSLRHSWVADPPLPTWFHGTPDRHLRNPFRIDLLAAPEATPDDRRPTLDGWFADELPDLNQGEPEVARYLIQNALWWAGMTGIDGVRLDTTPYLPRPFLRELTSALHRQHPGLWIVGEVLSFDPRHAAFYLGGRTGWDGLDTGLDSVFDFAGWADSVHAFRGAKPLSTLRKTAVREALFDDPLRLTTLTGNHDLRRFPSFVGASPESHRLHLAYTLASRGIPQLYYGDEIGLPGGDDPDNRRDMPGGFPGDPRSASRPDGLTDQEQATLTAAQSWIVLRRAHPALQRGETVDLFADDSALVFARRSREETILIALHRSPTPRTVEAPTAPLELPEASLAIPLLGTHPRATVQDGRIRLHLEPWSATAFHLAPNAR